jgi:hypothetical protein
MNKLEFFKQGQYKISGYVPFRWFSSLGLINYDNILKLVNYTTVICFHVIVRLINYFSIKEYLSGRIILLIIPLFND